MVAIDSKTLMKLYYLALVAVVIAGLAVHFMGAAPEAAEVPEMHGEEAAHEVAQEEGFWWLEIPLFAAGFAFIGGVILLALSKLGVYPLIKVSEDYYERHSIKKREEQEKEAGGEQ
jgi:membrane protein YqaA with SNARE-associated domain